MKSRISNTPNIQDKRYPCIDNSFQDDFIARFIQHAHNQPDKIALMTTEDAISYQQLYMDTLYWKSILHATQHHIVIVCLERTPSLIAILLALQWLGIPYIPVDPSIPIERLRAIIKDSQASTLFYSSITHPHCDTLACIHLDIAQVAPQLNFSIENLEHYAPSSQTTAYIIYTSGSTGTPKGVAISRLALNNFLAGMATYFLSGDGNEILLAITTLAFDIAALELYLPLWQQKTLFLATQTQHKDPLALTAILQNYPITLLQTTPAFWNMLLAIEWAPSHSLVALCGGEPLLPSLADRLLTKAAAVWNMYGPTEATVWCALKQIQANQPITIGHPIQNMEMYVMDDRQKRLPPYVKGELFISGIGLAEGYVNNPKLSQEKFTVCQSAFLGRLYRSGDLACTTENGEFIIFGRTDNQVKLHGYRIELEEIEAHLQTFPGVYESAVSIHHEQLVAYLKLLPNHRFSEQQLLQHLAIHVPEYMLPKRFVLLSELPKTLSGKIDRKALPIPQHISTHAKSTTRLTTMQESLRQIWVEELMVDTLHLQDNFFELGGHSLTASRIMVKIAHQFGVKINLNDFYHAPTLSEFTEIVAQAPVIKPANPVSLSNGQRWLPLHDFQLILWVSRIFEPKLRKFNVAKRKRIKGFLDKQILDAALQLILQKQEILSYKIHSIFPIQTQPTFNRLELQEISLLQYTQSEADAYLAQKFDQLFYKKTWRVNMPLISAMLYHLVDGQVELHICISHLLADEYSLSIFFKELSNAYLLLAHHKTRPIYHASQSYRHYIMHQHRVTQDHATNDAQFWKEYLQDAGLFNLPKHAIENKGESASLHVPLTDAFQQKLRQFCIQHRLTLNNALAAAIGLALFQCCGLDNSHPIVINTVRSTRDDPHYDNIIGCFLNIHPLKIRLDTQQTWLTLAQQAQQSSLETQPYQRASGLVKLAAIGRIPSARKPWKKCFISFALNLLAQCSNKFSYDKNFIKACTRLGSVDRSKQFLVNLNVLNNFLGIAQEDNQFLGHPSQSIPLHPYPVHMVKYVIDMFIHRSNDHNIPFLIITSNLTTEFKKNISDALMNIIENS